MCGTVHICHTSINSLGYKLVLGGTEENYKTWHDSCPLDRGLKLGFLNKKVQSVPLNGKVPSDRI
jgi:hypothetical protein